MSKCARMCACVCVRVCVLPMRYELVMIQLITGVYIGTTMHYNVHAFTTARYIDFKAGNVNGRRVDPSPWLLDYYLLLLLLLL